MLYVGVADRPQLFLWGRVVRSIVDYHRPPVSVERVWSTLGALSLGRAGSTFESHISPVEGALLIPLHSNEQLYMGTVELAYHLANLSSSEEI